MDWKAEAEHGAAGVIWCYVRVQAGAGTLSTCTWLFHCDKADPIDPIMDIECTSIDAAQRQ